MSEPTWSSGGDLRSKIYGWLVAHPNLALTLVVFAVLAPFLAKPFNIDDPLFIWVAHQIQLHPGNPYGFNVNWAQTVFPMWNVTENPPLAAYYMSLMAGIFGWSEIALHSAFMLPAIAVILGTHRLARHFCQRPLLAALATLFTPVFLVSSLTVMCDMLMLAFWVWAVVFWVEGMARDENGHLAVAGLLMAAAVLTKYYGMCLVPLLGAYGLLNKRRPGRWLVYLLIPLMTLYAYQVATRMLYGHNLLFRAMEFTSFWKENYGSSRPAAVLTALAFTGGGAAVAVFFAPWLWRRRAGVVLAGAVVLIAIIMLASSTIWKNSGSTRWTSPAFVGFQIAFWAVGGMGVLALAFTDIVQRRDVRSWLLALWLLGTFSFTAFFNWTVNGRSILPMTPVVGVLIMRRLEKNFPTCDHKGWPQGAVIGLAASAALALLVARADFLQADAVRQSAQQVAAKYAPQNGVLWFEGHWGFQYYMEACGAMAVDLANPSLATGDVLVVPANNTNLRSQKLDRTAPREVLTTPKSRFLATIDESTGAGFYASLNGPLPFAFGNVPPESVSVYVFENPAARP